ncbi:MAG: EAL domain-containing protein [Candidatus Competibacteraceae bacterium]
MPGTVAGRASQLVARLTMLALLGVWMATYAIAAGDSPTATDSGPGWFHSFRFGALAGVGLMLLGLAGGALVVLLEQRRRLRLERSRYRRHLAALNDEQRELETEIERQRAGAQTLRDSEQRLRNLAQQLPVGIFLIDTGGECRYVNDRWCRLSGLTAEQAIGSGWIQAFHLDDRDQVLQSWRRSVGQGAGFVADLRFRNPSGRVTWLNIRAEPVRDRTGQITGYLGAVTDIAERKQTEETLRASETRFRSFFESSPVGLCLTGPDKRWLEINDRLCEMLGYRREQLIGLSWAELTHPDDTPTDVAHFERVMSRRIDGYSLDKRFIRQDGGLLHANVSTRCVRRTNGSVDYFVTVVQDITERKQAEERILNLSQCDSLTGLPNRTLLSDRLRQVLLRAARDHTQAGVMLVDLDRFKLINDTLGHTVGDQLLREVAARLQRCVRECDTISRQGGDEFAVLLPDLGSSDYASRIAQRMLDALAQPCRLSERARELELHVTCSIGISLYPRDGHSEEVLLKNADIALYRAKDMGRNGYQFYLSGATILSRERLNLETSLRYAVERKEMELYYQPKWDFRAGVITGAEALIRWNHPELGLLSPAKFIPIAEDSGLVLSLGEWVLRVAIDEIGQMHRGAFPGLRIAVNLSVRQFRQSDLAEVVRGVLEETHFDPACLELELTEGILMHHTEENMVALRALKTMGVRIAIDDFGTGYSSLSYLQRFPVDVLKIDRSFVMELPASASSAAIVNAIVTLAHGLGLAVVAEGVETSEQMAFLQAHDCDEGQGYYFGHPLPLVEFRKLLERDCARAAEAAAPSSERPP